MFPARKQARHKKLCPSGCGFFCCQKQGFDKNFLKNLKENTILSVKPSEPAKKSAAQRTDFWDRRIYQVQDDWLIIQQVRAGEREAYAHLVDKYKDKLYGFLYRMTGQMQDAQDLTQEVFLKAFCQLDKYRPTDAFLAWLYRIGSNLCIDIWRKNKRYAREPLEEAMLIENNTPEKAYLKKEKTDVIGRQIMALGEEYRAAFLLKYTEQLSYKEISEILDLPMTTVQMRIHHAKKKLRAGFAHEMSGGAAIYELF